LLDVLCGLRSPDSGSLALGGQQFAPPSWLNPHRARALGLAHVPEDRHARALVMDFAAWESAVLGYEHTPQNSSGPWLRRRAMQAATAALMERFDVRPRNGRLKSSKFSGGNQQKLVLARELGQAPAVLLVGQPTRGVDIGAIEAAEAYDRLIKDFGMTQEEVALKVGKSRSAVANLLRLLKLTEEARQALVNGRITEGHARALLLAKSNDQQLDWLERVLTEGLNVRQTEALAKVGKKPLVNQAPVQPDMTPNPVAEALREHLMAPVRIESRAKRGKIVIEFFGEDDLTRIFDRLGIEVR